QHVSERPQQEAPALKFCRETGTDVIEVRSVSLGPMATGQLYNADAAEYANVADEGHRAERFQPHAKPLFEQRHLVENVRVVKQAEAGNSHRAGNRICGE